MDDLLIDKQGAITIATLNRPAKLNALNPIVMGSLTELVTEFNEDPAQRVLIITGSGDKAFSAGADLSWMKSGTEGGDKESLPITPNQDMAGVAASEKPIIAAINGLAVGGGLELTLCCDIRIAAEGAWFGLPEPERGFLAGIAVVTLARMMPVGAVMDMMLTCERLPAAEAHRLGLVQEVVPRPDLMSAAMRRAERMASFSQPALWATKATIKYWRNILMAEHHRFYEAMMHRVLLSGDLYEGLTAFAEKRKPRFTGGWPVPKPTKD